MILLMFVLWMYYSNITPMCPLISNKIAKVAIIWPPKQNISFTDQFSSYVALDIDCFLAVCHKRLHISMLPSNYIYVTKVHTFIPFYSCMIVHYVCILNLLDEFCSQIFLNSVIKLNVTVKIAFHIFFQFKIFVS